MTRPYTICHMMTSIDGRIDCAMTAQLKGVDEYYKTLDSLNTPARLSGRITAELEMALPGKYESKNEEKYDKDGISKKKDSEAFDIVVDTKGILLWDDDSKYEKHHLIITSENVHKEYLDYLDSKKISWIACGKEKINLKKAVEILYKEFNIKRLAVVGGPLIILFLYIFFKRIEKNLYINFLYIINFIYSTKKNIIFRWIII